MIKKILPLCLFMLFYSCSTQLPKPRGSFIVGTDLFNWEDFSRDEWFTKNEIDSRKIVVQIWYPAESVSDSLYPYMDNATLRLEALSKQIGVPFFMIKGKKNIKGNSYYKAKPIVNKKFPLIVFSHGLGGTRTQNSINIEELVSNGYIVIAPDHTYDASLTVFEDGTTKEYQSGLPVARLTEDPELYSLSEDKAKEKLFWETRLPQINTRAGDIKFIIDKLQTMNNHNIYSSIDFNNIGIFGHSFGGGTSIVSSWNDTRISACLNLDGWFVPVIDPIIKNGLNIPFCYLGQEEWDNDPLNYTKAYDFFNNCKSDAYFIKIKDTKHFDYADLPYFSKIGKLIGLSGKAADKNLTLNLNHVILGFFNEYLKNDVTDWSSQLTDNYETIIKFK